MYAPLVSILKVEMLLIRNSNTDQRKSIIG